jgi:1-acyl-sn-glycerol-3-phosphate acyltransferase
MSPRREPGFRALALRYARWRLGRSMDGFYLRGLERTRALASERPVIFAANHVAWWDPFLVLLADAALGCEGYALMDAANLEKLPFFARLGAFPIDRSSPRAAIAGLRSAVRLLDAPGRAVWIFPQGRQRPAHLRPLDLQPGLTVLAGHSGALVVPVCIQYAFREDHRPAAVMDLRPPLPPLARAALLPALEAALVDGLAEIDAFIERGAGGFEPLVGGAGERLDRGVGARLLGGAE